MNHNSSGTKQTRCDDLPALYYFLAHFQEEWVHQDHIVDRCKKTLLKPQSKANMWEQGEVDYTTLHRPS